MKTEKCTQIIENEKEVAELFDDIFWWHQVAFITVFVLQILRKSYETYKNY